MLINNWFQLVLITPVMVYAGWPIHRTGWLILSRRAADMNSLITIGTLAAFVYSLVVTVSPGVFPEDLQEVYYEAVGVIITLILLGKLLAGIPQIKPTFLDIAPSGMPSNIIPHSKGVKCGLIRSNSPFSYSNHRPAKPKIPKPLVYAQVSPLGTSFATP